MNLLSFHGLSYYIIDLRIYPGLWLFSRLYCKGHYHINKHYHICNLNKTLSKPLFHYSFAIHI